MKKTIEQQVAELTPEQKSNLRQIYKKLITSYICIILAGIVVSIGSFVFVSIKVRQAEDKYDSIVTQIQIKEYRNTFDFDLYDEKSEAFNDYYDMKEIQPFMLVTGCIVILVGTLILALMFKNKYPYFSEKKYSYLKKIGYYNAPQAQYTNYPNSINNYRQK